MNPVKSVQKSNQISRRIVEQHLVASVMQSFVLRPMPSGNITENELRRRQAVVVEIWNRLVRELRWSPQRAMDHILSILAMVIDGAHTDALAGVVPAVRGGHARWAPEQLAEGIEPELRLTALASTRPLTGEVADRAKEMEDV